MLPGAGARLLLDNARQNFPYPEFAVDFGVG